MGLLNDQSLPLGPHTEVMAWYHTGSSPQLTPEN